MNEGKPRIVIIGAGPAGLACAERLLALGDFCIEVYEQKPSAARKFLMAGKSGLNISHSEPFADFIQRYDAVEWLQPMLHAYHAPQIQQWMDGLEIQHYVGSSGRIFPNDMKAAPLLRAWLRRLQQGGVQFFYRHRCVGMQGHTVHFLQQANHQQQEQTVTADAIVLACGGQSWARLGSDGQWQQWLNQAAITPLFASNVGVIVTWSAYMQPFFGQPLKRIRASINQGTAYFGEMVISHYGLEGGLVYRCNRDLRQQQRQGHAMRLMVDLLPDLPLSDIAQKLNSADKRTLNTKWQKLGLDKTKIALLRDLVAKADWYYPDKMAQQIKQLHIPIIDFRPLDEAISCGGGIKRSVLNDNLGFKQQPWLFACGEMLDWDAPTGGYLLTACLASGRYAAEGVVGYLTTSKSRHDD